MRTLFLQLILYRSLLFNDDLSQHRKVFFGRAVILNNIKKGLEVPSFSNYILKSPFHLSDEIRAIVPLLFIKSYF